MLPQFVFVVLCSLDIAWALGIESYENYYNEIFVEDEHVDSKTRNAVESPSKRWPERVLFYRISSDYNETEVANVHTALAVFNEKTCLSFEELPEGTTSFRGRYISYMKSPKMCGTRVGYTGSSGSHDVVLNERCLSKPGIIQHETLHVLGLFHEQSRTDRDEYVKIEYNNISPKYWSQFGVQRQTTTYDVPYEYDSIMHYSKNAFAKDPSKPTMLAIVDGEPVEREMGQIDGPTEGDLYKVRKMYQCD